ncbi:MAG: DUF7218 family protein [Aquaticitalea sp.]
MAKPKDHGPSIKNDAVYEALIREGNSPEKAARIANSKNPGKKGGKAKPYEDRTKKELYDQAKEIGIEGRSKMNKKELIYSLRHN